MKRNHGYDMYQSSNLSVTKGTVLGQVMICPTHRRIYWVVEERDGVTRTGMRHVISSTEMVHKK